MTVCAHDLTSGNKCAACRDKPTISAVETCEQEHGERAGGHELRQSGAHADTATGEHGAGDRAIF